MSPEDTLPELLDCGGDAAAYVLGALSPSEVEDFRRHLNRCVVCRDEIAAFGRVCDALAMAVPRQTVPRSLRRSVLRAVREEPGSGRRPIRRPRLRPLLSRGFVPRPAVAAGWLATVVLAIVGGLALAPGGSDGVRVVTASVSGGQVRAQVRVSGAHAELIVSHLPAPAAGRIYELWIKRGLQAPSPTRDLFSVTGSGAAEVGVPGDVRGVSAIMVTQERAGGSLVPTHAPVIFARLT
jgi:anti-sigma-K factor RskA